MTININNYEAYFLDYHEGNLSPQQVADLFLFLSQHPELKKELEEFEHIVLEDFSAPVFENKDRLKKNITAENREGYFIRAVEGTLDATELTLLNTFLITRPEFLTEFNLFQKTKLQADAAIVFENKTILKQGVVVNDDQLIAAVEGLLTKKEQLLFEQQLAINPEMQRSFAAYQQTKVIADANIIFKYKQTLKRTERKVVPLYYYIAVAASLILLLGILFLLRTGNNTPNDEQRIAEQKTQPVIEQQKTERPDSKIPEKKSNQLLHVPSSTFATTKNAMAMVKKSLLQKSTTVTTGEHTAKLISTEEPITDHTVASSDIPTEKQDPVAMKTDSSNLPSNMHTAPVIAQIGQKEAVLAFPSVRDLLTSKLKEKLMGKDAVAAEQKITAPTKITGWDIAGLFAKGLSKLTGKKVEVKPQFNSRGDITAYALSAGKLEFSKSRMK